MTALALPASAGAIAFGGNLNLTPNTNFDCTLLPVPDPFGNATLLPSFQQTCTWMAVGTVAQPFLGSTLVPGNGVVTQVRVRVGGTVGPMRVVVLRAFRDANSLQPPVCCQEVAETTTFTPPPNSVFALNTALPVRNDGAVPDPVSNLITFDSIAISILTPGVAVPLFDTGSHDPANFSNPQAAAWFPAFLPGQQRTNETGVGGFQVLLNGEFAPTLVPPAGGGLTPVQLALVLPAASVNAGRAAVSVRCLSADQCRGLIVLQSARAVGAITSAKRKTATYGKARYSIAAGKAKKVKVKLSRAGKRLLKKHRRPKVWLNVTSGGKTGTARVTLKR
ncbi:MAG TPA: hypothetical protein VH817_17965 [Thermoleophilaceae bacterium]